MWIIVGILAVASIAAAIEIPSLHRDKKELWVFSILLLSGTGLSIAESLEANIPNPLDWIAAVYRPLGDWMTTLQKG
jgi:hypothetical protein